LILNFYEPMAQGGILKIIKIKSQLYVFNCVCFKDLINFLLVIMQINVNANANACSLETFY